MSWRDAFLKQARSDYSMFQTLNKSPLPICHKFHYLQMASEKLAKAYLCGWIGGPPKKTHKGLVDFLKRSKARPELRRKLGYHGKRNYGAYVAYIDSLLGIAGQIEGLAPMGNLNQVNPEYPWKEEKTGDVICPVEFGFPGFEKAELVEFNKLIANLFRVI
jgi:hypothetical protein